MTAIRRPSLIVLSLLLAAATAAADTVITAKEVIPCSVVWSDTNFTRLKLPNGSVRMLYTCDIRELRLSDPGRVIEQAPRPPQVSSLPDSAQPAAPPPVAAGSIPCLAIVIDTLPRGVSPDRMAARCREMNAVLRDQGRSDAAVLDLLREVAREQEALRRIWPQPGPALCLAGCVSLSAVGGGCAGLSVGEDIRPTKVYTPGCIGIGPGGRLPSDCIVVWGGGPVGAIVGLVAGSLAGSLAGAAIGSGWRAALVAQHRGRVNDLVRRVNRAIAATP